MSPFRAFPGREPFWLEAASLEASPCCINRASTPVSCGMLISYTTTGFMSVSSQLLVTPSQVFIKSPRPFR